MIKPTHKAYTVSFILVVLLAGYFRLYNLNTNPPGFFTDEAAIGYNSYKILTTGRDEYEVPFPLFFKSYGDYRLPLPIYLNIPSILIFGPTDYATRITAAFAGTLTVMFLMLAISKWLGKWAGIGTGLSIAILPWHIHVSRWASEYVYFPLFFSISFLLLILFFKLKRRRYLFSSFFVFGLTMYTYYPAIFTVPLFLLIITLLLMISFRRDRRKLYTLIICCFIYIVTILPILGSLSSGELMTRWKSLDAHKATISIDSVRKFTHFYVSHYDPKFLFVRGDETIRHAEQDYGEVHMFQGVFILFGFIFLILRKRSVVGFSVIGLFLLYPLGSAITFDRLVTRSIIGVVPISILTGVGIAWFVQSARIINNRFISITCFGLFCLTVSLSTLAYGHALFAEYPTYAGTWDGFQYGYKQAMEYCLKSADQYDECRITHRFNRSEGLMAFYKISIPCSKCLSHPNPIEINPKLKQLFFVRDEDVKEAKKLYPELNFYGVGSIRNPGGAVELKIGYFR